MNNNTFMVLLDIGLAFIFAGIVLSVVVSVYKIKQLKRYTRIYIGMSSDEMLTIMGRNYNVSSLKNNRQKYEWRINSSSYGRYGYRSYTGVKKVDIYVKDGYVEEIRPYNV